MSQSVTLTLTSTCLYSRTKIFVARVSYAADNAHRPPLHGFAAAAELCSSCARCPWDEADGQTDTAPF